MDIRTNDKLDKIEKQLEKKNEQFRKASPAKKRVMIAKDVISQLKSGKIVPDHTYFSWPDHKSEETAECLRRNRTPTNMALLTSRTSCEVCGIGSLFVAALERDGRYKLGRYKGRSSEPGRAEIVCYLTPYFDRTQLQLIEAFFEQDLYFTSIDVQETLDPEMVYKNPIFTERDDRKRLEMIMENIIENNGQFIPCKTEKGRNKN